VTGKKVHLESPVPPYGVRPQLRHGGRNLTLALRVLPSMLVPCVRYF